MTFLTLTTHLITRRLSYMTISKQTTHVNKLSYHVSIAHRSTCTCDKHSLVRGKKKAGSESAEPPCETRILFASSCMREGSAGRRATVEVSRTDYLHARSSESRAVSLEACLVFHRISNQSRDSYSAMRRSRRARLVSPRSNYSTLSTSNQFARCSWNVDREVEIRRGQSTS
jgi:hypothetical protein